MPRIYDTCLAKCPFFISSGKKTVLCEGITDDCLQKLIFTSEEARNLHRKIFCDESFENCEIYKIVLDKYQD